MMQFGQRRTSVVWQQHMSKPQSEVPSDQTADWQCQSHICVLWLLRIHIPYGQLLQCKNQKAGETVSLCVGPKAPASPSQQIVLRVPNISQSNLQLAAECHMCQLNSLWLSSLLASREACGPPEDHDSYYLPCFLRLSPAQATPVAADHDQCWLAKVNCIWLHMFGYTCLVYVWYMFGYTCVYNQITLAASRSSCGLSG
jgi:hypothetical protein